MASAGSPEIRPWEKWIESESHRELLWSAKANLRSSWEKDRGDRRSYPINTSHTISILLDSLSNRSKKRLTTSLPEPKAPKTIGELVPDKLIRTIWSENHAGSFTDALKKAAGFGTASNEESYQVFSQILGTIEIAYRVSLFGWFALPKPKVNILHRGLDLVAKAAGLGGQSEIGFSEFLDDLCPCGLKQHREAVRKMRRRQK